MELQSDFSFWWAILAFGVGTLISLWYYRIKSSKRYILLTLRILAIGLISLLLCNPYSVKKVEQEILPKIVVLHDNSLSIDSLESQQVLDLIQSEAGSLDKKELVFQPFANGLEENNRDETDIALAINEVIQRDKSRLENILIISDGISNKGVNPLYQVESYTVPIHTIALGDSTHKVDLKIETFKYPKEASSESNIPFDLVVKGPKSLKMCTATFTFNGKTIEQKIKLKSGIGRWAFNQFFDPKTQEYVKGELKLNIIEDEVNTLNNSQIVYIRNKKSEYTIHLVYDAPNPDIAVWQRALSKLKNTKIELVKVKDYQPKTETNQLSILFAYKASTVLESSFDIHVIGNNKLRTSKFDGLPFGFKSANVNSNVTPRFEKFDNLFSVQDIDLLQTVEYKAAVMPFGELSISGEHQNIISQNTDGLENTYPILASYKQKSKNKAVYFGEGLWQYATTYKLLTDNTSDVSFELLLNNLVMYLLKSTGQERLEIFEPINISANETQIWSANFINQNNEKVTGATISLQIENESNEQVAEYTLTENQSVYQAEISGLASGIYTYFFSAEFNGKIITKTEKVLVNAVGVELLNLQANYEMLRALSTQTGGAFIVGKMLDANYLKTIFQNNGPSTVVYKNEKKYWADYWFIWALIITFLTLEWLIRRRNGLI
jgi:hypothetical protein